MRGGFGEREPFRRGPGSNDGDHRNSEPLSRDAESARSGARGGRRRAPLARLRVAAKHRGAIPPDSFAPARRSPRRRSRRSRTRLARPARRCAIVTMSARPSRMTTTSAFESRRRALPCRSSVVVGSRRRDALDSRRRSPAPRGNASAPLAIPPVWRSVRRNPIRPPANRLVVGGPFLVRRVVVISESMCPALTAKNSPRPAERVGSRVGPAGRSSRLPLRLTQTRVHAGTRRLQHSSQDRVGETRVIDVSVAGDETRRPTASQRRACTSSIVNRLKRSCVPLVPQRSDSLPGDFSGPV